MLDTQPAGAAGNPYVTSTYWEVGGFTVTSAEVGDSVVAKAVLTAQGAVSGTWKIVVRKDIFFAPDFDYAQTYGNISLADLESQTLSLTWSPDQASGDGDLNGYFIEFWFNGSKIYSMTASYPPRLTVTGPEAVVTAAYWQIGSSNVTTARVGDSVVAKAVVTAQNGPVSGSCTLKVRKDIILGFDLDYAQTNASISLAEGASQTLSVSWSPDQATDGVNIRGYLIEVWFNGSQIYLMADPYPPRLTVTAPEAVVTGAYWQVGSSNVTIAQVGDSVAAKAIVTAQNGPVSGSCTIKVRKDTILAPDLDYAQTTTSISLAEGASQELSLTWSPDQATDGVNIRGYLIEVWFNGSQVYLMADPYPPRLTVTSATAAQAVVTAAYWQVGSSNVTAARVGDSVVAKAVVTAQGVPVSGCFTLKVRKDLVLSPDLDYTQTTASISLAEGASQTLSLSWSPDQAGDGVNIRGYFIEVWFNSSQIYLMADPYPPRLTVTAAQAVVTAAYWQIGSSNVTTAKVGDSVVSKAVVTAQNGPISGSCTIKVRKDLILATDLDYAQATSTISLAEGASQTLSLSWSPDQAGDGVNIRGYFIEVWFNSSQIYLMADPYPPRLTVTAATGGPSVTATVTVAPSAAIAVTSALWEIGGSTVTTAQVGDSITAKAVVTAQGGPVIGNCTLKVRRDIILGFDLDYAQTNASISLADGASQTLSLSWSPDHATDGVDIRGYFIEVWLNGSQIYAMPDFYPPRLTVTAATGAPSATATPTATGAPVAGVDVTGAYWEVDGSTVTTARVGDSIMAKVVLTACGTSVSDRWKIVVRKDIATGSDQDYAQASGDISLAGGASQTLSLSWSPDQLSSAGVLNGYLMEVWFNDSKVYTMAPLYPPSLTVLGSPAGADIPLIGGIIGAVMVIGTAVVLLVIRKRSTSQKGSPKAV